MQIKLPPPFFHRESSSPRWILMAFWLKPSVVRGISGRLDTGFPWLERVLRSDCSSRCCLWSGTMTRRGKPGSLISQARLPLPAVRERSLPCPGPHGASLIWSGLSRGKGSASIDPVHCPVDAEPKPKQDSICRLFDEEVKLCPLFEPKIVRNVIGQPPGVQGMPDSAPQARDF